MEDPEPGYQIYRPVDSKSKEIRLVTIKKGSGPDKIQCTLTHVSLEDPPPYEALSYVWGSQEERSEISLQGCDFSVTRNLGIALTSLRFANEDRAMWIDAICVNQDDTTERSAQVQLMRNVYQGAEQVVSWINNESVNIGETIWIFNEAKNHEYSSEWARDLFTNDLSSRRKFIQFGYLVIDDEYWARVWITQEVAFARKGVIKCPEIEISYGECKRFYEMLAKGLADLKRMFKDFGVYDSLFVKRVLDSFKLSEIFVGVIPGTRLLDLLRQTRFKKATDPRDKLYAMLGLSDMNQASHDGLNINYSKQWTKRHAYTGIVRAIIETTSDLDILSDCITCLDEPKVAYGAKSSTDDLPSWVPDWTKDGPRKFENRASSRKGAAGSALANIEFSQDMTVMKAQGVCVGSVRKSGKSLPEYHASRVREDFDDVATTLFSWRKLLEEIDDYDSNMFLLYACDMFLLFGRTILLGLKANAILRDLFQTEESEEGQSFMISADEQYWRTRRSRQEILFRNIHESLGASCLFLIEPVETPIPLFFHGYPVMGVGPKQIREKDMICALRGCKYPVVLRPDGDGYRFVSTAYVDNLWDGQAVDFADMGLYEWSWFEIH